MKKQKTIGVIIFRRSAAGIRYLLLHHGKTYWNFPKGRQEAGESDRQTALRELAEETGITAVVLQDGFRSGYEYSFDGKEAYGEKGVIHKQASFFLAEAAADKVTISDEHINYGWFTFPEALKKLRFEASQSVLKAAEQFLSKK